MKRGIYGVYGKNGAGIFNSWEIIQKKKYFVVGFKCKKFGNAIQATKFCINGLAYDYNIADIQKFNGQILIDNFNKIVFVENLISHSN